MSRVVIILEEKDGQVVCHGEPDMEKLRIMERNGEWTAVHQHAAWLLGANYEQFCRVREKQCGQLPPPKQLVSPDVKMRALFDTIRRKH